MKVRAEILELVNNTQSRIRIAADLGVDSQVVHHHMRGNRPNGHMTKMVFLLALSKETGVPVTEILEGNAITDHVEAEQS